MNHTPLLARWESSGPNQTVVTVLFPVNESNGKLMRANRGKAYRGIALDGPTKGQFGDWHFEGKTGPKTFAGESHVYGTWTVLPLSHVMVAIG